MKFSRLIFSFTMLAVIQLALVESGCRGHHHQTNSIRTEDSEIDNANIIKQEMPRDSLDVAYRGLSKKVLIDFYRAQNFEFKWLGSRTLNPMGDSMASFIDNLVYVGLFRDNYHYKEINELKKDLNHTGNVERLEALLSNAFLSVAADVKYGCSAKHSPDSIQMTLLSHAIRDGTPVKAILSQEPTEKGYRLLKNVLKVTVDSLLRLNYLRTDSVMGARQKNNLINIMLVNLERWRLDDETGPDQYICVNIPSFMLEIISHDCVIFESRVIVGRADKPTPLLKSKIECIITYPYWYVPRKISAEEFLPQIKKDLTFISKNNFEVLDRKGKLLNADSVKWQAFSIDYFPVSLRQREGSDNSLGVLKFSFDNPYSVYLHDTNARQLFRSSVRTYSHGCVRVEKAEALAHYLITGVLEQKSPLLTSLLRKKERYDIELVHPMPVYIRYLTCEVRGGKLCLYQDIYDQDQKLLENIKPMRTL